MLLKITFLLALHALQTHAPFYRCVPFCFFDKTVQPEGNPTARLDLVGYNQ